MRQFYMAFPIGDALRSQLSWTHYRLLMRIGKEAVRNFYIEECISSQDKGRVRAYSSSGIIQRQANIPSDIIDIFDH